MSIETILMLIGTGLFAGLTGGLFGIGGGVVVVPALYAVFLSMGIADDVTIKLALGTSVATIIVTTWRSVRGHAKHGDVEWPVLWSWGPFIGIGALLGAAIARYAHADGLTAFFGAGLLAMGIQRVISASRPRPQGVHGELPGIWTQRGLATGTGVVSSLLGIGGGVIGVLLLTRAGRGVHRAVGTASGFGFAIAVPGAIGYALAGIGHDVPPGAVGYVHIPAFLAVAVGAAVAAPIGARLAARFSPSLLTGVFGAYVIISGTLMLFETIR